MHKNVCLTATLGQFNSMEKDPSAFCGPRVLCVCVWLQYVYPLGAVQPEAEAAVVLAEKVIKVTSDSSPDKEATTGTEPVQK